MVSSIWPMTAYLVLRRGVNVGGKNKVPTEEVGGGDSRPHFPPGPEAMRVLRSPGSRRFEALP